MKHFSTFFKKRTLDSRRKTQGPRHNLQVSQVWLVPSPVAPYDTILCLVCGDTGFWSSPCNSRATEAAPASLLSFLFSQGILFLHPLAKLMLQDSASMTLAKSLPTHLWKVATNCTCGVVRVMCCLWRAVHLRPRCLLMCQCVCTGKCGPIGIGARVGCPMSSLDRCPPFIITRPKAHWFDWADWPTSSWEIHLSASLLPVHNHTAGFWHGCWP